MPPGSLTCWFAKRLASARGRPSPPRAVDSDGWESLVILTGSGSSLTRKECRGRAAAASAADAEKCGHRVIGQVHPALGRSGDVSSLPCVGCVAQMEPPSLGKPGRARPSGTTVWAAPAAIPAAYAATARRSRGSPRSVGSWGCSRRGERRIWSETHWCELTLSAVACGDLPEGAAFSQISPSESKQSRSSSRASFVVPTWAVTQRLLFLESAS